MCGIVGYIGEEEVTPVLLSGLSKLEYRGYDSAGIAVLSSGNLCVCKAKGVLENLKKKISERAVIKGTLGIGHTRWATHGEPSDINSHPHTDVSGAFAVVHNGIIENHRQIKSWLAEQGISLQSETDTEVVAHLIGFYYENNLQEAVAKALTKIEGSYALGIVCKMEPDKIIAVRKESPLVIGAGDGENLIASDVTALLEYTKKIYNLDDGELAVLYRDRVEFFDTEGKQLSKELCTIQWDAAAAERGGYEHFMLKEIHEQPKALTDTLRARIKTYATKTINLEEIGFDKSWADAGKVELCACGTAWHAATIGKYAFEYFARIEASAEIASEYRYRDPILDKKNIFIIISQSGETADTLAAMRMARKNGIRVIAITNVVGSTLAREADMVMYTWAGPEIAVASTKAFTTQLMCLYLIALKFGALRGIINEKQLSDAIENLENIGSFAEKILENKESIQRFAANQFNKTKVFFMGRLFDFAVSLESALKLKEISYTHSEAFAAGEFKHGPIALVDKSTLIIAFCTQPQLFEKMDSNIKEVKARGATVAVITFADVNNFDDTADEIFRIPRTNPGFTPILSVIPCQLFAYYCAVQRGLDPDKPRNLAKSVTVE